MRVKWISGQVRVVRLANRKHDDKIMKGFFPKYKNRQYIKVIRIA